MKRAGNITEKIADYNNLYLAFYKASKAKRTKPDVIEFENNLDENIKLLQGQILTSNVNVGNYTYFKIFDPKERTICAASFPERVLHHALMNICHPYFEKQLIYHTYATRIGKGTYKALDTAKIYVKKYNYCVKLDVRKYFDSISHQILSYKLNKVFKDKKLNFIFSEIIKSYHVSENKGIPIGNLTSQYFANYYLSAADRFAKEKLKIPAYIRYMDDILLFANDKNELKLKCNEFIDYVSVTCNLNFKPMVLTQTKKGVSYLGYRLFPYNIKLNKSSKKRFKEKLNHYNNLLSTAKWTQAEYSRHIQPLFSFVEYANTKQLRSKFIEELQVNN